MIKKFRETMKKILRIMSALFFNSKCQCGGTIKHIGEEPFGKWNTYKNIYECNKCNELFI